MARAGKKQLNAHLSEEAYERLRTFTSEHGSSMVSFLEALCLHLDPAQVPKWLADVIRDARRIEAESRRRSKPKHPTDGAGSGQPSG